MRAASGTVSVIMPVFNGEPYIQVAVESLLRQTWRDWELIVVDDGSTDRTSQIVEGIGDRRIICVYQENRGQSAALNRGLSLASGSYVTTLDADDWYPEDSLAVRASFLHVHPDVAVVYGDGVYVNGDGEVLSHFSSQMPAGHEGDVFDTLLTSPFYGTGAAVMIRRSFLQASQIRYDESLVWCQDWDFYLRLAARTDFRFVRSVTVNYRVHEAGMTVTMPAGRRLDSLVRMRLKALASNRFARVAMNSKRAFFYDVLMRNLAGDPVRQTDVVMDAAFRQLHAAVRSELLRQLAISYLLSGEHLSLARRWLRRSWLDSPRDVKTLVALALAHTSPALARNVTGAWQQRQQREGPPNPFDRTAAAH